MRIALVSFTNVKYNIVSLNKGILYIATVLRDNKYPVKVFQRNIFYHSSKKSHLYQSVPLFIDKILEFNPDIIGITFTESNTVKDNIKYISLIRKKCKRVKIIVGGPHITATMDEIFGYADVDFAFYGESEYSFLEFVKKYPHYEDVQGLIYRKDNKIVINPPSGPIENLDKLPFPDYRLVYGIRGLEKSLLINYIVFSRGCPYCCNFCYSHRVFMTSQKQKSIRFRSPSNIVDEIEFNIKLNKVNVISVGSESFTFNRRWVMDICKEIIRRKLKLVLFANTRYDLIDDELLKIMKKAGFKILHLGIESGSKRILNMYNKMYRKDFSITDYKLANELLLKNGIVPRAYIMLGNPFETILDTFKTLSLMTKVCVIHFPQVFDPYPGTEWYKKGLKNGIVEKSWYLKKETTIKDNVSFLNLLLIYLIIFAWRNKFCKKILIKSYLIRLHLSKKKLLQLGLSKQLEEPTCC